MSVAFEEALVNNEELKGVAFDLAKAFDNIPIEITFEVMKRLGMDERLLKAALAMYKQIGKRFKINGYVGEAFSSTNGILQGCPLSVMLLNGLMAVLHKVLEKEVGAESYVDDLTIYSDNLDKIKAALKEIQKFMRLTDQKVNVSKTKAFGLGEDPVLRFDDKPLSWVSRIKLLGVNLDFQQDKLNFTFDKNKLQKLTALLGRIRHSGLHFDLRTLLVEALVGSRLAYGIEILDLDANQEKKLRTAVGMAVWQKTSTRRSPGLLLTLFAKGHTCDPAQAPHVRRLLALRRAAGNNPDFMDRINGLWSAIPRARRQGFIANLKVSLRRLGVKYSDERSEITINDETYNFIDMNYKKLAHDVRESARLAVWKAVEKDRARSGNATGLEKGIDRNVTLAKYKSSNVRVKGILRTILTGATWTQQVRAKMPRNTDGPMCKYCGKTEENLEHLWWDCSKWTSHRTGCEDLKFISPPCLRSYGLLPSNVMMPEETVNKIQSMMVNIFTERFGAGRLP